MNAPARLTPEADHDQTDRGTVGLQGRIRLLFCLGLSLSGSGIGGCHPPADPAIDRETVTYAGEVAAILQHHCAGCHSPHGSAPFSLRTYAEAAARAQQIAEVVNSRYMPPWLPADTGFPLQGERRLRAEEQAQLTAWADQGAPAGGPTPPPPAVDTSTWQLGDPDLIVRTEAAYRLAASGPDVYRNLVLTVPLEQRQFVRAIEFRPSNPRVVHHAVIRVDATGRARGLDRQTSEPGFGGMSFGGAVLPGEGHFLGWTPGKAPDPGESETAWPLEPGTDLVVQLHLQPSGKPEQLELEIGLHFAAAAPTKFPFAILLRNKAIDIPAGDAAHLVEAEYELPVDVALLAIYPHAHFLGRRLSGLADLPDGTTLQLLEIHDWDFNWQDDYRFVEPVDLPRGTVLRMKYLFDNSAANPRNPFHPPQRVRYGPQSTDEMAELLWQVLPQSSDDLAQLRTDFRESLLAADLASYEARLEVEPHDIRLRLSAGRSYLQANQPQRALFHLQQADHHQPDQPAVLQALGETYRSMGRNNDAVTLLERAVQIDPAAAHCWNLLGTLWLEEGEVAAAIRCCQRALEERPGLVMAEVNLGNAYARSGDDVAAERHYRRALERHSGLAVAEYNWGNLLLSRGAAQEAIPHYRRAIEANDELAVAHANLGVALQAVGQLEPAIESYQRALQRQPELADAHNNLGVALQARGQHQQAIRHFRAALAARPGYQDAERNLAHALQRVAPDPESTTPRDP